jgi:2-polyprenyl-3-methyl-5-hydroxy-6-metoxy-1,4-benzoquinol methylase
MKDRHDNNSIDIREKMEQIYRELPLEKIPWNVSEPPRLLVDAVKSGRVKPCKAVDLGCGAGNYAVWMARQGFEMTGLDISAEAIKYARELAEREGMTCRFAVLDLLGDVDEFSESFDFGYDWELLHHIFPGDRPAYVSNVHRVLKPDATYLSVCFSEKDRSFGGHGKYRDTTIGTRLYFSSEQELRDLFSPHFDILELTTVEVSGKRGPHQANIAWLRRK